MKDVYLFQYCQKLVIFNENLDKVLLCKRRGEIDFDGVFSFIGGKMETTDENMWEGISREKNEEIGNQCKIKVFNNFSYNGEFLKKDGSHMILSHYMCIFMGGDIILNDEYSEFKWVSTTDLKDFEPKIKNIYLIADLFIKNVTSLKEGNSFIC